MVDCELDDLIRAGIGECDFRHDILDYSQYPCTGDTVVCRSISHNNNGQWFSLCSNARKWNIEKNNRKIEIWAET